MGGWGCFRVGERSFLYSAHVFAKRSETFGGFDTTLGGALGEWFGLRPGTPRHSPSIGTGAHSASGSTSPTWKGRLEEGFNKLTDFILNRTEEYRREENTH